MCMLQQQVDCKSVFVFSLFTLAGIRRVFFVVLLLICFLSDCLICYQCYWGFLSSSVKFFFHREAFYYMTNWYDLLKKLGKKNPKQNQKHKPKWENGDLVGSVFLTWWLMGSSPSAVVDMQTKCRKELFGGGCWTPFLSWNKLHKIVVKYFSSVPQDVFSVLI